jgi:endonuclease YncB( thermonuclease family)
VARLSVFGFWATVPALLAALISPVEAATPADRLPSLGSGTIVAVIDGDTVRLDDGRTVRLVGVSAPELNPERSRRGIVEPFAREARVALEKLTRGRTVTLRAGETPKDRFDRVLAHLVTAEGVWVQGELLRQGAVAVYTFPDNRALAKEMLALEEEARRAARGLWGFAETRVQKADEKLVREHFTVIEGRVRSVARVRDTIYLNFGDDYRRDFTIRLRAGTARAMLRQGLDTTKLEGALVRVRGWVFEENGPMVDVTHAEQMARIGG